MRGNHHARWIGSSARRRHGVSVIASPIRRIAAIHRDATIRPGIWLMTEVTVRCSIAYEQRDFAPVVEMIADGRVRADPLHTRTVGLSQLADAMTELGAGNARDVKVLVDPRA